MIDFTTIQTSPIPPEITTLVNENVKLHKKYKFLKGVALGAVTGTAIYGVVTIIKKNRKPPIQNIEQSV